MARLECTLQLTLNFELFRIERAKGSHRLEAGSTGPCLTQPLDTHKGLGARRRARRPPYQYSPHQTF
ncbi:MAG: hypothetical protein A2Y80_09385 [Deltaproteobacteria bacterium RBG_13_58_19]|nr:MAG: hypothetical protein A2Y80_09385 [Deltaproteobacteria bacterium RBG_13_58_19]